MLEAIAIISNGLVIIAIGILWNKVDNQEKALNKHIINFTRSIANRPNFDQIDAKIAKATKPLCQKVKGLAEDFKHHVHEGSEAKVVL